MNTVLTIEKLTEGTITMDEARELLWVSERTLYRYKVTYLSEWPPGFIHGLKGKRSNNINTKRDWLRQYVQQKRYEGFGPTLLAECLERHLWYPIPVSSLRRRMIQRGVWLPQPTKKVPQRKPRQRKSGYWLMVQFDGSYHDWLENGQVRCLLIAVDDATGKVCHASFTKSENINDVIAFRIDYFHRHGKPSCIYLDRHSCYKVNHGWDQFDREMLNRFQHAMRRLWVQVIYARSPQWKGRVENKYRTFQDRGIKMMRLAKLDGLIKNYDEAQDYLQNVLVPMVNEKFGVEARESWDFHVPLTEHEAGQLEVHFGKRSTRKLNKIGIVRYNKSRYRVEEWQTLEHGRTITVVDTHLWTILLYTWETMLRFEKLNY